MTGTRNALYQEDVVRRKEAPHNIGLIVRCWHDPTNDELVQFAAQNHGAASLDPMLKPLQKGEVAVMFWPSHAREVGLESQYTLVDRPLRAGDIVKRDDGGGGQSGVVIEMQAEMRLAHAISGVKLPGWVKAENVEPCNPAVIGSYVIFEDWVGQVVESFEEIFVQLASGKITRVPEMGPRLTVGDRGMEILPPTQLTGREFGPNPHASAEDTVVHIYQSAFAISWLAINQKLPQETLNSLPRPPRFFSGAALSQLTLIMPSTNTCSSRVNDKVHLLDPRVAEWKGVAPTIHGEAEGEGAGRMFEVRTMVIKEGRTKCKVWWQDGGITEQSVVDAEGRATLVPYIPGDSDECWPGDHVLWKGEDVQRHAVVQSVNPKERTARVLFTDTSTVELVPLLELDVHGTSPAQPPFANLPHHQESANSDPTSTAMSPEHNHVHEHPPQTEMFSLRIGEFALIHREGTTNGLQPPRLPIIGEVEPWAHEPPSMQRSGKTRGWRKEFQELGMSVAEKRSGQGDMNGFIRTAYANTHSATRPLKKAGGLNVHENNANDQGRPQIDWFGEVTGLRTDGLLEISLPDRSKTLVPLNRLSKLSQELDEDMEEQPFGMDEFWEEDDMDVDDAPGGGTEAQIGAGNVEETALEHELLHHNHQHHYEDEEEWENPDDFVRLPQHEMVDDDEYAATAEHARSTPVDQLYGVALDLPHPDTSGSRPASQDQPGAPPQLPIQQMGESLLRLFGIQLQSQPQHQEAGGDWPDAWEEETARQPENSVNDLHYPGEEVSDLPSTAEASTSKLSESSSWTRFEILPSAPPNHAFLGVKPHEGSKGFINRLQKEYRVLRSSLPENILVRAFENRTDLLRSLIIGPENTPYEDAPFIIDWLLDSEFPQTPPKAHFHSWTQGHGRCERSPALDLALASYQTLHILVNPNLYEDGKVCLSILGTWSGDRTESWSATQSTLLQAFVSIQGLVLVKEPWYCEPGFEHMRGTEEGIVNSRHYNEKAYILSRNFVRVVLETPGAASGFESELDWFYYDNSRLHKVVKHANDLIAASVEGDEESRSDLAIDRLTEGGTISLKRTLPKLHTLLQSRQRSTPGG